MLSQKPEENSSKTGVLKIRDTKGVETEVPVKIEVQVTPTNWQTIYSATGVLWVIHSPARSNDYFFSKSPASSIRKPLSSSELMRPFAGSDFWIADLGLEFLHWPKQHVVTNEMRHYKASIVVESTNPEPIPRGYARVKSWITTDTPHVIVHAEAFDSSNELIKKFDPKNLEKINGQYELESMEIRSPKADSRTILEFDLK